MDGNGFTNKEMLIRLEEKMDKIIEIYEERIVRLERFKAQATGILSFLTVVLIPLGITALYKF